MSSSLRDRIKEPPLQVQAGNAPLLANSDLEANYLEALAQCHGNLAEACRIIGVSRSNIYRHMARDNLFRDHVAAIQTMAIRGEASEILAGAYQHLQDHIKKGWEYERDDNGNIVYETDEQGEYLLDHDFEMIPRRRSTISIKSLEGLSREMRHTLNGEQPTVAIQNVANAQAEAEANAKPKKRPRLVLATKDAVDAEFVIEDPGGTKE